jgi:hypothetical protein
MEPDSKKFKANSLQEHAYMTYVQSLSIPEQRTLIKKIEQDIRKKYRQWRERVNKYIETHVSDDKCSIKCKSNFSTFLFHANNILHCNCFVDEVYIFYIKDASLQCATKIKGNNNITIKPNINIDEWSKDWKSHFYIVDIVEFFYETHPGRLE